MRRDAKQLSKFWFVTAKYAIVMGTWYAVFYVVSWLLSWLMPPAPPLPWWASVLVIFAAIYVGGQIQDWRKAAEDAL